MNQRESFHSRRLKQGSLDGYAQRQLASCLMVLVVKVNRLLLQLLSSSSSTSTLLSATPGSMLGVRFLTYPLSTLTCSLLFNASNLVKPDQDLKYFVPYIVLHSVSVPITFHHTKHKHAKSRINCRTLCSKISFAPDNVPGTFISSVAAEAWLLDEAQ
jgi:hypothetical protein